MNPNDPIRSIMPMPDASGSDSSKSDNPAPDASDSDCDSDSTSPSVGTITESSTIEAWSTDLEMAPSSPTESDVNPSEASFSKLPLPVPESFEEAQCIINIAYAERRTRKAEKRLADRRVSESAVRTRLYGLQAAKAKRKLEQAQVRVGRARWAVRKGGYALHTLESRRPKSKRLGRHEEVTRMNVQSSLG